MKVYCYLSAQKFEDRILVIDVPAAPVFLPRFLIQAKFFCQDFSKVQVLGNDHVEIMKVESFEHNISTTYQPAREWESKPGEDESLLNGLSADLCAKLVELSTGRI